MVMRRRRVASAQMFVLAVLALGLGSCKSVVDAVTAAGKQTYPSIWINSTWSGGRTGTALETKSVEPTGIIGKFCPATSMVPLNHPSAYAIRTVNEGLYVDSNCSALVYEMAACESAGSGQKGTTLGICGTDPRQTALNNLKIQLVPPLTRGNVWYGETNLNISVNFFYCATGSHLNLGEVPGKAPTDCVVD